MDDEQDKLVNKLGLTRLDELDPSQEDYVSRLEQGYEDVIQIANVAREVAMNLGSTLMDLTEVTPLNTIDSQNPHTHYFVERDGVVYQVCSSDIADLLSRGAPLEAVEELAFVPLEGVKLDDLSAEEKAEFSQEQDIVEGHLNLYAVTHPSNRLSMLDLTSKATHYHTQQMKQSQMPLFREFIEELSMGGKYEIIVLSGSGDLEPDSEEFFEDEPESSDPKISTE